MLRRLQRLIVFIISPPPRVFRPNEEIMKTLYAIPDNPNGLRNVKLTFRCIFFYNPRGKLRLKKKI